MSNAIQTDQITPYKKQEITFGSSKFKSVKVESITSTSSTPLSISGTGGISLNSGTGVINCNGSSLSNVSEITSDPDVITKTSSEVQTVGQVTADLLSYTTLTNTVYFGDVRVVMKNSITIDHAVYAFKVVVKNINGAVTVHSMQEVIDFDVAPVHSDVFFESNGPILKVRATGENGATMKWKCILQLLRNL